MCAQIETQSNMYMIFTRKLYFYGNIKFILVSDYSVFPQIYTPGDFYFHNSTRSLNKQNGGSN